MNYIAFWISKVLVELIIIAIIILIIVCCFIPGAVKRWKCKHENYIENGSCDAICRNCGKNLGFIGTLRHNKSSNRTDAG